MLEDFLKFLGLDNNTKDNIQDNEYEKAIINMINKKSTIGLYILTMYSWRKNH